MPTTFARGALHYTFSKQVPLVRLTYQNKTSYLFGSCHIASLNFSPRLQGFLESQKTLIVESYKSTKSITHREYSDVVSELDSQTRLLKFHQLDHDINVKNTGKNSPENFIMSIFCRG